MPGQLGNDIKEDRSRRAIAVAEQMSDAYRQAMVGTTVDVLFEEPDGAYFTGHAPNYVKVYVTGDDLHNRVKQVTIEKVYKDGVLGSLVEEGRTENEK